MGFNIYTNFLGFLVFFSSICLFSTSSRDFISSSKFIKDPDTFSSGDFKLGFFSPENSTNRYVGIWYLSESNVIWVANRNQPLKDSSGLITISEDGNLAVLNGQKHTLWSTNVSNITSSTTLALLTDTGNLLLEDTTTGSALWGSFEDPSDSLVPKMTLVSNPRTGKKPKLPSWKSPSDPSIRTFSASLERLDAPEVFIWNGSLPYWRSGPWNGQVFLGVYVYGFRPSNSYLGENGFHIQTDLDGNISIAFNLANMSDFAVFKLDSMGKRSIKWWQNQKKNGAWSFPSDGNECNVYGQCGAYGICDINGSPVCSCLSGFKPRNLEEWHRKNWTSGCVRKAALQCEKLKNGSEEAHKQDGFQKLQMVKPPDFAERSNIFEDICKTQCLQNCSCVAYAHDESVAACLGVLT